MTHRLFSLPCCLSPRADDALARTHAGRARLFTVDYGFSRAFCDECGVRAVPCVHIYRHGAFLGAHKFAQLERELAMALGLLTEEEAAAAVTEEEDDPWERAYQALAYSGGLHRSFG